MFSSCSNNGISLPQLSPCFKPTTSFVGLSDNEILLHHPHDLLFRCLSVAPVLENAKEMMLSTKSTTSTNPAEIYRPINGGQSRPLNAHSRKKPLRKDRHSKILTAQGPKERRVRLSINIARKFFDLQDLLGFDKASKTLDWLLTKSKTAIRELRDMKHTDDASAKSLRPSAEFEVTVAVGTSHKDVGNGASTRTTSKRKRMQGPAKHKGAKFPAVVRSDKFAKESRAKARERARERTEQKICLRKASEAKKSPDLNRLIRNQTRPHWSHIGPCTTSDVLSSVNFNTGVDEFFYFRPGTDEVDTDKYFKSL